MVIRIFIGFGFVMAYLALIFCFEFWLLPLFMANGYRFRSVLEDDYSDDLTCYHPIKENREIVSSYQLNILPGTGTRYLELNYARHFDKAKLYVVLFDYQHKAYDIRKVNIIDSLSDNSRVIILDNKVRGVSIQFLEVDGEVYQTQYPVSITNGRLFAFSLISGLFSMPCTYGLLFAFNFMIHFSYTPIWLFVVCCLVVGILTTIATFFILRKKNAMYLEGGEKE